MSNLNHNTYLISTGNHPPKSVKKIIDHIHVYQFKYNNKTHCE